MALLPCVWAAVLAAAGGDDLGGYEAARARAGGSPEGLVRLALWCERHGLEAERVRSLALAVLKRPDDSKARALLGMVKVDGRWRPAGEASDWQPPRAFAQYQQRRARADLSRAEDHWRLALWCERHGLESEARAHLISVTRLQPGREAAWTRLGFRRHRGRWMTPEQIVAEIADAEAQRAADRHWGPELDRLRTRLHRPGPDAAPDAADAAEALDAVRDPRAVPQLWEVFVLRSRDPADHARAARVLGRIDGPEATLRLVRLAASSPHRAASEAAAEALPARDPRDVIEALIGMFRTPPTVLEVPHPGVGAGSDTPELWVEGERVNYDRFYAIWLADNPLFELNTVPVSRSVIPVGPGAGVGVTTFPARAVADFAAARRDAAAALARDRTLLQRFSASVIAMNERVEGLLLRLTGFTVADGPDPAPARPAPPSRSRGVVRTKAQPRPRDGLADVLRAQADLMAGAFSAQALDLAGQLREARVAEFRAGNAAGRRAAARRARDLEARLGSNSLAYGLATRARAAADRAEADTDPWQSPLDLAREPARREQARAEAWRQWWAGERGYSREPAPQGFKPTVVQVRLSEVPVYITPEVTRVDAPGPMTPRPHNSCFAAGTPVHTRAGRRPIESVQVGDLVLSQDTATGALDYRPVTAVHHRRPAATYRVVIGGESMLATGIHRFWKAGTGWVMARDLKPGDLVRTVGGVLPVASVAPDAVRPVFNLDVDGTRSFFVGDSGALVHDDRLPAPVVAAFDAPGEPR